MTLASSTKTVNGVTVPDIDAMFAAMLVAWTYGATTITPWTAPASTFQNLWENLAEGAEGADQIPFQIGADFGLMVDPFNRLMDIWHQDQAAALDPRNAPVASDAWRELISLLVQSAKARLFPIWRSEEATLSSYAGTQDFFGSLNFIVSLREPVVGDWPPPTPATQPLIDPTLVTVTDLPELTAGGQALSLWNTRSTQVSGYTTAIRSAREGSASPNGVQAALKLALGNPLPADLDQLAQNLLSSDPTAVAAATTTVETLLFMSVDFSTS